MYFAIPTLPCHADICIKEENGELNIINMKVNMQEV